MTSGARIALIRGDGIGNEFADAAMQVALAACRRAGAPSLQFDEILAGAGYFAEVGVDIVRGGGERAGDADAIFLGAIGLPSIRHADGTEISPHLRLRGRFGLYAGVRPVKAYPNAPQRLVDTRAAQLDLLILRESTEGLFYSAAAHGCAVVLGDDDVRETLRIARATTEKLHRYAFRLTERRRARGRRARLTCVDKANVFTSMAFFRKIFDEVAVAHPETEVGYNYINAQALDLVRRPWEFDILVMENMFDDVLSDLAGGLGIAACAEIGDHTGPFQPAQGGAPDIMGQDKANPLAAILSAALMLDYLAEKTGVAAYARAGHAMDSVVEAGFATNRLRPMEFGEEMGTRTVTDEILAQIDASAQFKAAN